MCHRELKRTGKMHRESLRCLLSFILAAALINPGFAQTVSPPRMSNDAQQVSEKGSEQQVGASATANSTAADVGSMPGESRLDPPTASMETGIPSGICLPSLRIPFGVLPLATPQPPRLFPEQATPSQSENPSKGRSKSSGLAMLIIGVAAAGGGAYLLSKGLTGHEEAINSVCPCISCPGYPYDPNCEYLYQQCLAECRGNNTTIKQYNSGEVGGGIALLSGGVLLVIAGIRHMH